MHQIVWMPPASRRGPCATEILSFSTQRHSQEPKPCSRSIPESRELFMTRKFPLERDHGSSWTSDSGRAVHVTASTQRHLRCSFPKGHLLMAIAIVTPFAGLSEQNHSQSMEDSPQSQVLFGPIRLVFHLSMFTRDVQRQIPLKQNVEEEESRYVGFVVLIEIRVYNMSAKLCMCGKLLASQEGGNLEAHAKGSAKYHQSSIFIIK